MDLACRLANASNLAYCINDAGTGFTANDTYRTALAQSGLVEASLKVFQSPHNDGIDACYCGELESGEQVLAFRGTMPPDTHDGVAKFFRTLLDWLNDAEIEQVEAAGLPGKVHKGFSDTLANLWPGIEQFGLAEATAGGKPLYVTGHSKGGAVAFLAAYRLLREGIAPAEVYTFAAARAGNGDFASAYDAVLAGSTLRYEYQDDLVPHLPAHTAGWLGILEKLWQVAETRFPQAQEADGKSEAHAHLHLLAERVRELRLGGLPDYVSAGTLRFINWDKPPAIEPDSLLLAVEREISLAKRLMRLELERIAGDHSLAASYIPAICR